MIATLILVVCLAAAPGNCRDVAPPIPDLAFSACALMGQQIAQEWLGEHPKWELRGWRCRVGGGRDS